MSDTGRPLAQVSGPITVAIPGDIRIGSVHTVGDVAHRELEAGGVQLRKLMDDSVRLLRRK